MQNFKQSDSAVSKVVFHKMIEDLQGGVTVSVADYTDGFVVPAGSVVGKDSNGLFHVLKTAKLTASATNTATAYSVEKGHGFKVGDFLATATGAKAYAITAINTSDVAFDVLTVGTTLGVVVTSGQGLFKALAESASNTSAFSITPFAVTGQDLKLIAGDNNFVDAYLRATLFEVNAPVATAQIKAALPQILWI